MRSVPSAPIVGPFADRLLRIDLPALPAERRAETIDFVTRRVDGLPSVTYLGVLAIGIVLRGLVALPGDAGNAVVRFLGRTPIPLIGEYVRMIRSLGYAYVWDTWSDTRPDGAMAA